MSRTKARPMRRPQRTSAAERPADPAFAHALAVLDEVLRFDSAADGVLSRYFRAHSSLGSHARGAVAEGVYAVLRNRSVYEHFAQSGHGPMSRRLMLLALFLMGVDTDRAANEGERAWLAHIALIDRASLPLQVRSNLPEWLWDRLVARFGEAEAFTLADGLNKPAPMDVRVNRLRMSREQALEHLAQSGATFAAQPAPHAPDGIRFVGKPALHMHPLFEDGTLEVQDEGSQLLVHLLGPKRGEMVVDFCAGAGGKTLAIGALMRNTGRLYAFDVNAKRLDRFKPRLARSGLSNVVTSTLASEHDVKIKRLAGKIDRVLVDAPCSGLGTLRRNPDLKWRQSPQAVEEMARKQASILASAARLTKNGGRLVYATCSLLEEENESIAQDFLARHPNFSVVHAGEELARARIELPMGEMLRLAPHTHGTDGFFAAVFERRS